MVRFDLDNLTQARFEYIETLEFFRQHGVVIEQFGRVWIRRNGTTEEIESASYVIGVAQQLRLDQGELHAFLRVASGALQIATCISHAALFDEHAGITGARRHELFTTDLPVPLQRFLKKFGLFGSLPQIKTYRVGIFVIVVERMLQELAGVIHITQLQREQAHRERHVRIIRKFLPQLLKLCARLWILGIRNQQTRIVKTNVHRRRIAFKEISEKGQRLAITTTLLQQATDKQRSLFPIRTQIQRLTRLSERQRQLLGCNRSLRDAEMRFSQLRIGFSQILHKLQHRSLIRMASE